MARPSKVRTEGLPYSEEGEKGSLSSMLVDNKTIPVAVEKLKLEDFYIPAHQEIFTALKERWENGKPSNLQLLTQHLRDKDRLNAVGGAAFVTSLYTYVPTGDNIAYYIDIVREKSKLRQLIAVCTDGITKAHSEQDDARGVISSVQVEVMAIQIKPDSEEKTLADHVMDKIDRMQSGEPDSDVIPTKIKELDIMSPLRMGDMPLITGERKDGKSILALSILENICIGQKRPGLIFSLEDRTPKLIDRIFAGVSRIPMSRLHVKQMTEEEIAASTKAAGKIKESGIIIVDDHFELPSILAKAKRIFAEFPHLAVMMVDYAQLVEARLAKDRSREQEVAAVSRAFRRFAMETGVPIILLSQLNATGMTRESKALEQDATANWRIKQIKDEPRKRRIEIPWQRNGESGVFLDANFFGEIARVENLSRKPDLVEPKKLVFIKNGKKDENNP